MRRPVFLLLLILLQITLPVKLSGQKPDYRLFDNISLGTEASVINCFLQDTQGLIWIGSNKGLFSYDGYSTQPHFTFAKRNNTQIYCGTVVDSTYLYLGADNGLLIYNYRTDTYEEPETISVPGIKELPLTLECRVIYKQTQDISAMTKEDQEKFYPQNVDSTFTGSNRDTHVAYYCLLYTSDAADE